MKEIIAVFIGSGLGGLARFGLSKWINSLHTHYFPFGTLAVNLVACFALGFIIGLADQKQFLSSLNRLFWTVGFCGGFSTFSTFSNETLSLFQQGHYTGLIFYILTSLFFCVMAIFCGLIVAEQI